MSAAPIPLATPAFTLSASSEMRIVNTAATGFSTISSGGSIASFALSPAAPAGMSFNTATGALSGTPTTVASAVTYTITATNTSGSATQNFAFTVSADIGGVGGGTGGVGGGTGGVGGGTGSIGSSMVPVLSIDFLDTTLTDVTIGVPYNDFIHAEARIDGLIAASVMTYAVDPTTPLPTGLVLDASTGIVTGTVPDRASTGIFTYSFTATTPGFPMQTLAISLKILDKPPSGGVVTPAPVLSIEFTDQTLNSSTIGAPYSDQLVARTLSDGSATYHEVSYALAAGSPDLPLGLTLNSVTGFVTGTIDPSVLAQTVNLLFTAASPDYTTTTTTAVSYMVVNAPPPIAVVPLSVSGSSELKKPILSRQKLMLAVLFANNSSTLSRAQILAIKKLSVVLLKMNLKKIMVVGYTNAAPGVDNQQLAIDRAKTLVKYLKLNRINQSIVVTSVVSAYTKVNNSASALIELRKAEIWVVR